MLEMKNYFREIKSKGIKDSQVYRVTNTHSGKKEKEKKSENSFRELLGVPLSITLTLGSG